MKYDNYSAYDSRLTSQTIPALATIWPSLGDYYNDLVLVGGLVPHFICKHPEGADARPKTLDVDLGISLYASAGQYGTLSSRLIEKGFKLRSEHGHRFEKMIGTFPLYVDFLTDVDGKTQGGAMVNDVVASITPGVSRALATARVCEFTARDLYQSTQNLRVRVCEVGPYLVLKLRAFAQRQAHKDAFDILYTLKHYDKGIAAAVSAFKAERDAKNPAFADAEKALRAMFDTETSPGPVYAAHFVTGEITPDASLELAEKNRSIRQDTLTGAAALLRAV